MAKNKNPDKELIISLREKGHTLRQIGEMLKLTPTSVKTVLNKAGIETSEIPALAPRGRESRLEAMADEVIALYESGLNCREVAKKVFANPTTVLNFLKSKNINTSREHRYEIKAHIGKKNE